MKNRFRRALWLLLPALFLAYWVTPVWAEEPDASADQGSQAATSEHAHSAGEAGAHHEGHGDHGDHGDHDPTEFQPAEIIMEHILDQHAWHLTDIGHTPVSLPLPWILYSSEKGLDVFSIDAHSQEELHQALHERGYQLNALNRPETVKGGSVIDFSITKTVLQMLIVALIMLLVFTRVAKAYRHRAGKAPKGLQNLIEPIILFVRDDIAKPNLHGKHDRFLPFLLTVFFFIWMANLFGLTPFNVNITGNISVTAALALFTFMITQLNTSKDFWAHVFWFPGVPVPVKLIMLPVEIIGIFTKPFALMLRLFANIAAGHFMVVSLIMMIFIIGEAGKAPVAGWGFSIISVAFDTFILLLELLVAVLQAYVFTVLSAVFIGQAMETHSHGHDHDNADSPQVTSEQLKKDLVGA